MSKRTPKVLDLTLSDDDDDDDDDEPVASSGTVPAPKSPRKRSPTSGAGNTDSPPKRRKVDKKGKAKLLDISDSEAEIFEPARKSTSVVADRGNGKSKENVRKRNPANNGGESSLSAETLAAFASLHTPSSSDDEGDDGEISGCERKDSSSQKKGRKGKEPARSRSSATTKSPVKPAKPRAPKKTEAEKAADAAAKEAAKAAKKAAADEKRAAKAVEKERNKEAKKCDAEKAKEEKAIEAKLADINKVKRDRTETSPEMIVDISSAFFPSKVGRLLEAKLNEIKSQIRPDWRPCIGVGSEWNLVKWRRKIKAEYDEGKRMFTMLAEPEIRDEKFVLVYLTASEFAEMTAPIEADGELGLDEHVQRMKEITKRGSGDEEVQLWYLIEGLRGYISRNKNRSDQAFMARARAHMQGDDGSGSARGRPKKPERHLNEDMAEDAILRLQLVHKCLVHHSNSDIESALWISKFTEDISLRLYRLVSLDLSTSFCTEHGQVKPGSDAANTFILSLQQIHRVTPSIASSIQREYPTVVALLNAFKELGVDVLQDLPVGTTKSGVQSDRFIGKAISRRVASVFLGIDPWALHVENQS